MTRKFPSWILTLLIIVIPFFTTPVFADNSESKTISLDINWIDDQIQDRPDEITIELYRVVDGEIYDMDSETLYKKDEGNSSTWKLSFTYLYGEVWEYAFKITNVEPFYALYNYEFIETGNGTDHYNFDYIYGKGSTEMTIITRWDENIKEKPDSLTIELYNLEDSKSPERTITISGSNEKTWSATVKGLENPAANYFIVVNDLPEGYSNHVSKEGNPNIYINTISYNPESILLEEDRNYASSEQLIINNINGVITSFNPLDALKMNGILGNLWLNIGLILAVVIISAFAIDKHRRLQKRIKKKN